MATRMSWFVQSSWVAGAAPKTTGRWPRKKKRINQIQFARAPLNPEQPRRDGAGGHISTLPPLFSLSLTTKECPSSVAVTIRTPGLGVILRRVEERVGKRAVRFGKASRLAVLKGPSSPPFLGGEGVPSKLEEFGPGIWSCGIVGKSASSLASAIVGVESIIRIS